MPKCLLALGSNVGDREATLASAFAAIDALPDVRIERRSGWHHSPALGGPSDQPEFINTAALVDTTIAPLTLLSELQSIEARHGRTRDQRWAPRTLDIDILLYGNEVSETEMLTVPHPRMSFRRFVLEPATAVAPKMLHPIIGWPVERLLLHLTAASDQVAILSPSAELRDQLATRLAQQFAAAPIEGPQFATADQFWPSTLTTWIRMNSTTADESGTSSQAGLPYAAAAFPKLNILLDCKSELIGAAKSQWSTLVRRPGRGPTLRLQTADVATIDDEVTAAVQAVWPT